MVVGNQGLEIRLVLKVDGNSRYGGHLIVSGRL